MFRSLPSTTSRLGRLVRLMLLVSVWQAPIPWIHAHATDDSARSDQRLAYHLEQFHSNLRADGMAEAGWHLHFGLPFELLGEPSEETPSGPKSSHPRVETPLLTTADVSIAAVSGTEAISWIVLPWTVEGSPVVAGSPRPANIFATYPSSAAISVLICVARC